MICGVSGAGPTRRYRTQNLLPPCRNSACYLRMVGIFLPPGTGCERDGVSGVFPSAIRYGALLGPALEGPQGDPQFCAGQSRAGPMGNSFFYEGACSLAIRGADDSSSLPLQIARDAFRSGRMATVLARALPLRESSPNGNVLRRHHTRY